MQEFISEDELKTFEGWMKYQAVDPAMLTPEQLAIWQGQFEDGRERAAAVPKVGLMKLRPVLGEHRYAVAVRDGSDLLIALWVRRSRTGEFFVMHPTGDRDWDAHTSYHLDGTLHWKSFGYKTPPVKRQALTGTFRGAVHLGQHGGYGPKGVGAVCDPTAFSGVVEVASGVLGPRHGYIAVDLVEPGCEPVEVPFAKIVTRQIFRDALPWVVITVVSSTL